MNLYWISQSDVDGWDTFSDAVVAAESEEVARSIHPRIEGWYDVDTGESLLTDGIRYLPLAALGPKLRPGPDDEWTDDPNRVTVKFIGKADDAITERRVICSSFHAG